MNPHHPDILPQHAQRDIAFKQALSVWAKQHRSRGDRGRQTQVRLQRLAASLAIPVVIGRTAGYMRLSSPTPVSAAEALLHRATHALRAASPNQAIHAIYAVAGDGGGAATLDEWVQPDANGGIAQGAITTQDNAGHIQDRTILSGEQATTYNAVANTIVQAAVDQVGLPNPLDAAALTQYIQTAQQGGGAGIHLLASTTIDGHSVAAVGIQQPNNETAALYIDKQSSIIRKFDLTRDGDPATSCKPALGCIRGGSTIIRASAHLHPERSEQRPCGCVAGWLFADGHAARQHGASGRLAKPPVHLALRRCGRSASQRCSLCRDADG